LTDLTSEMPTRTQPNTSRTIWLLVALVFLATFFRFHDLGVESYWKDETVMAHVTSYDLGTLIRHFQTDARPPAYVLLGHFWLKAFGTSDTISRVLPVEVVHYYIFQTLLKQYHLNIFEYL